MSVVTQIMREILANDRYAYLEYMGDGIKVAVDYEWNEGPSSFGIDLEGAVYLPNPVILDITLNISDKIENAIIEASAEAISDFPDLDLTYPIVTTLQQRDDNIIEIEQNTSPKINTEVFFYSPRIYLVSELRKQLEYIHRRYNLKLPALSRIKTAPFLIQPY